MRHNKAFNHLGRKSGHRKAMLANMASSLIMHKRINTTVAKAKALKSYVEPLITKTKEDIMAELSTKIVKFSEEEKRADDEKLNNVIGSLHAGIQALVNDYAGNYPVSVFINVGGQTDRI